MRFAFPVHLADPTRVMPHGETEAQARTRLRNYPEGDELLRMCNRAMYHLCRKDGLSVQASQDHVYGVMFGPDKFPVREAQRSAGKNRRKRETPRQSLDELIDQANEAQANEVNRSANGNGVPSIGVPSIDTTGQTTGQTAGNPAGG